MSFPEFPCSYRAVHNGSPVFFQSLYCNSSTNCQIFSKTHFFKNHPSQTLNDWPEHGDSLFLLPNCWQALQFRPSLPCHLCPLIKRRNIFAKLENKFYVFLLIFSVKIAIFPAQQKSYLMLHTHHFFLVLEMHWYRHFVSVSHSVRRRSLIKFQAPGMEPLQRKQVFFKDTNIIYMKS